MGVLGVRGGNPWVSGTNLKQKLLIYVFFYYQEVLKY